MTQNLHCPIIHGGLQINLKTSQDQIFINHCCLRDDMTSVTDINSIWQSQALIPLRNLNLKNQWAKGCWHCEGNEKAGQTSSRTGMLEKFGTRTNLSGPQHLDLMFDIGCNLACRICAPDTSTYWQRHLTDNRIPFDAPGPESRVDNMMAILQTLDLSNLEMVVFSGGETLLGQGYWRVAKLLTELVPNAQEQLTVCFQTNGTMPVAEHYYPIIEKCHLVKLHISLDGVGNRFEYQRWPAKWNQVAENILNLKETLPTNVMFLVEETMNIFNLYYQSELETWVNDNFSTNRLGDITNHTRHPAKKEFALDNLSQAYVDAIKNTQLANLIKPGWQENPDNIRAMIDKIQQFDTIRGEDWRKTFPEVTEFYSKFL
jgi:pyruvate-formate lyase-activating enzyme